MSSSIQVCGKESWSDTEKSPSIHWRGYSAEMRVGYLWPSSIYI